MMRSARLAVTLAAALAIGYAADPVRSVTVTISNMCSTTISLDDNSAVQALEAGASTTRALASGFVGMFRNGAGEEATLADISVDAGTGQPWYDISIIPPGPGNCGSLAACRTLTDKMGFNTAISITPLRNVSVDTCRPLVCMTDGCTIL